MGVLVAPEVGPRLQLTLPQEGEELGDLLRGRRGRWVWGGRGGRRGKPSHGGHNVKNQKPLSLDAPEQAEANEPAFI